MADTEYLCCKLRIDLGELWGDYFAHQRERFGRRRRRFGHALRAIEFKAGVFDDFLKLVAGMHACQCETSISKSKSTAIGHQTYRAPRPKNIFVIDAGRADEIDLRNERAAGMLGAKQDYFGHDIIKVGGTERAGEPNLR